MPRIMVSHKLSIITVIFLLLAACTPDAATGTDITISNAWIRPATADTMTAAFMTIKNNGAGDINLIQIESDLAEIVELHETTVDENDVARMRHIEELSIPSGASVELRPGSYHLMFMNINRGLVTAETVNLTLKFDSGAGILVEAVVSESAP